MANSYVKSFLPSDELIFERSKRWSNFFGRVVAKEAGQNYEEIYYDDIPCHSEEDDQSDTDEIENRPVNNCEALVKVDNFEGSSSSDEFDVNDLINETIPIIEERKRRWKESGMDRVLDTFDVNAITDKVGAWLRKARMQNCMAQNSSIEDAQIMHFEDHHIQFHSDESVQSADTVKYIRSNRKPRAASCTTMTIKRFRYVKGKQNELHQKYNYLSEIGETPHAGKMFLKTNLFPSSVKRLKKGSKCASEMTVPSRFESYSTPTRNFNNNKVNANRDLRNIRETPTSNLIRRHKSRKKKRRSNTSGNRSVSSSSSSSSNFTSSRLCSRPKFRRISRNCKKESILITDSSLNSTLSENNDLPSAKTPPRCSNIREPDFYPKEVKDTQLSNLTGFLPENIVNSTAHSSLKPSNEANVKYCQLSPISRKVMPLNGCLNTIKSGPEISIKNGHTKKCQLQMREELTQGLADAKTAPKDETNKTIIVYDPEKKTVYRNNISNGKFTLTKELLQRSIGQKLAQRFIKFNARKFPWSFDSSSTIYFQLPTESEESHRSGSDSTDGEDVLNMFGKQGQIIEQPLSNDK